MYKKYKNANINLIELCNLDDFQKEGDYYRYIYNPSISIKKNTNIAYDYSSNYTYNPVNFLTLIYGLSYDDAILLIKNKLKEEEKKGEKEKKGEAEKEKKREKEREKEKEKEKEEEERKKKKEKEKEYQKIEIGDDILKILYDRCIDIDIVHYLAKKDKIKKHNNKLCFIWHNDDGYIVGADCIDCHNNKYIVKSSNKKYGFKLSKRNPKKILLFESSIDLLSYLTIYKKTDKTNNILAISTSGMPSSDLLIQIKNNYSASDIYIMSDNDKGGDNYISIVSSVLIDNNIYISRPPQKHKDYNDYLVSIKKGL